MAESARRRQRVGAAREETAKENMNARDLGESSLTKTFHIFIFWGKARRGVPSEVYGAITLFVIAANVTITECTELKESRSRKRSTFA